MEAAAALSDAADKAARASEEAAHAESTVEAAARKVDEAKRAGAPRRNVVELESALHAALDRAEAAEVKAERAVKAVERLRERLGLDNADAPTTLDADAPRSDWERFKAWLVKDENDG